MHGTPKFHSFHQLKTGQEWRVERRTIPRLSGLLDHYSAPHYSDVIMSAMASQITGVLIVYSTICLGADQRKHQSSSSLVCVRGIHRWLVNSPQSPMNSPHKTSDAEHISIWWRHHENRKYRCRRVLLHEMWSEYSPVGMCFNDLDKLTSERISERSLIPRPPTPHSRWVPPSWGLFTANYLP